jgi:uroporphyrinogen decarboxylase
VGSSVALQGNLDPNVLFAPPEAVAREAVAVLDSFGPRSGRWRLGRPRLQPGPWHQPVHAAGHVSALVEAVHSHSRRLRNTA